MVYLHGFDWGVYAKRIMPAFTRWLIDGDETTVYQLYKQTRSAQEERYIPDTMHQLRAWTRAQAFVQQLARGPHARREYQKLCSAEQFTELSDRYVYQHTPQLYQDPDAVRTIWGAIVEEHCLPWFHLTDDEDTTTSTLQDEGQHEEEIRSELISLLHSAGLGELAQEVHEQVAPVQRGENEQERENEGTLDAEDAFPPDEEDADVEPKGVAIGRHPTTLHLRGWLASRSVRAMALFELLACGRRCMPFDYEVDEPFGAYIGYLTPEEVWQLALCLRDTQPPDQAEAEADYQRFRNQDAEESALSRVIDEVLPAHANVFVKVVRIAALQGLGLLCSVE